MKQCGDDMENKCIRVLQVFASLNMGGAESRMMDVFRCIDRTKYQFVFLTMQTERQYFEDEIRQLGGEVIKIKPPRESGVVHNLKEMTSIMREGHYDAVHAHTSFHCGMVMLAAKRAGIPVRISHSRTTGSKHGGMSSKLMLSAGKLLIKRYATQRLAISKEAGAYLFGKSVCYVLPNAIDLTKYEKAAPDAVQRLRNEFGIINTDLVIGQVGRFDPMKNHGFSLQLFSELLKDHPRAMLVLIGDGPLREEREHDAQRLGIADRVIFTGVRQDVNLWMQLFDVLIVPSVFEGLGGVILEAQAAGTPVVKSDTFTNYADLQLGLVSQCSLDSTSAWIAAIERKPQIPTQETIAAAFQKRGFSLGAEVEYLMRCYENLIQ